MLSSLKNNPTKATGVGSAEKPGAVSDACEEKLETMVDSIGTLDLDNEGHWDYYGHSSGMTFARNLRDKFNDMGDPTPRTVESSSDSQPSEPHLPPTHDLPSKDVALLLIANALNEACCLARFVHKPTFYRMLNRIYDTPPDQFSNAEKTFLPQLYSALALGCMLRKIGDTKLDEKTALEKG